MGSDFLTQYFANGLFGVIGQHHRILIPLLDFSKNKELYLTDFPKGRLSFCVVLTKSGLFIGRAVLKFIIPLLHAGENLLRSYFEAGRFKIDPFSDIKSSLFDISIFCKLVFSSLTLTLCTSLTITVQPANLGTWITWAPG